MVPPGHTPRRVLYQGAPGSPTGTLYEVVGEVPLVQNPPTVAGTSQQEGGTWPSSSGKDPSGTRSGVRRKNTGSVRTGRDQSPIRRTSDRSRTPDRAHTPIRSPVPARVPRGTPTRAPPTSPADGLKASSAPQPPSRVASSRDPRTTPSSGRMDPVQHLRDDQSPPRSVRMGTQLSEHHIPELKEQRGHATRRRRWHRLRTRGGCSPGFNEFRKREVHPP